MSENLAAKRLVDLIPAIMQRWDDRVRAEVSPAAGSTEIVLRDSIAEMLAVMAKVLGVPVRFIPQARPDRILAQLGLDADGIAKTVRDLAPALGA